MKISVLDGLLIDHRELTWSLPERFPDYRHYDSTTSEETLSHIGDANAIFVNRIQISREIMEHSPHLQYIGLFATGYNNIDLQAAKEHHITVCNVPDYSSFAVAQHTMALLLAVTNRTSEWEQLVRANRWKNNEALIHIPMMELAGKTVGILGYGSIGRVFGKMAVAMGMQVLAYRRNPDLSEAYEGLRFVSLEEMLSQSDVVSLHCPLSAETNGMVNRALLGKMKKGAILINTARGAILNESDVAEALESGQLSFAALDVLTQEPPQDNHPLVLHPRCLITPHVAWAPEETRARLIQVAEENFNCWLQGKPQNVVCYSKLT